MLDLRIWTLITAMTPSTAPQSPSKKLERNLRRISCYNLRPRCEGHGANTSLVMNQLFKQRMTSNGEPHRWDEHTHCYHNRSCKRLAQSTIYITALEPNE